MNKFGEWYPKAFTAEYAIIQERKIPYDCLVKNINLVAIDVEELGRRLAKVDIVLQKRGCYRAETKFGDFFRCAGRGALPAKKRVIAQAFTNTSRSYVKARGEY